MVANIQKLKGKMAENGYVPATLSKEIGICTASFYRKINGGGLFTLGEAHGICKALSLSRDEAISIFLPEYSQKCEN